MFSWRSCSRTWTAQAVGYKFSMVHSHVKPSLWPSCHWDISLKSHVKKTTHIKLEHATYTFYFLYQVKFPPGISHFSFLVTFETAPPPLSLHLNNDWGMTELYCPLYDMQIWSKLFPPYYFAAPCLPSYMKQTRMEKFLLFLKAVSGKYFNLFFLILVNNK